MMACRTISVSAISFMLYGKSGSNEMDSKEDWRWQSANVMQPSRWLPT